MARLLRAETTFSAEVVFVLLALVVVAACAAACTDEHAASSMGLSMGLWVGWCSPGVCFVRQVCEPG
jgi:hypothetical protein